MEVRYLNDMLCVACYNLKVFFLQRHLKVIASVIDLLGGGSRSTTPASLGSRKSPTNDQGVQVSGNKKDERKVIRPIQPPGQRNFQQRERNDSRGETQQDPSKQQYRPQGNRNQNSQNNQRQGGWTQRGQMRQRGRSRGNYKPPGQPSQQGGKPKTLKFEKDYDFEQANTKFEELRSQLGKVIVR